MYIYLYVSDQSVYTGPENLLTVFRTMQINPVKEFNPVNAFKFNHSAIGPDKEIV